VTLYFFILQTLICAVEITLMKAIQFSSHKKIEAKTEAVIVTLTKQKEWSLQQSLQIFLTWTYTLLSDFTAYLESISSKTISSTQAFSSKNLHSSTTCNAARLVWPRWPSWKETNHNLNIAIQDRINFEIF